MKKRIRLLALCLVVSLMAGLFTGCKSKRAEEIEGITFGIDVARYQGTIDWQKVAATGVDFAMIRVGYRSQKDGLIKEDPNARYNLQEAQANGIKIGAYFFSTAISHEEAQEEADWIADILAPYSITFPVAYNCEGYGEEDSRQYTLSRSDRTDIALTFLSAVKKHGYEAMFYASKNEMENSAKWEIARVEQDYKVWVAQYPVQPYPETRQTDYNRTYQMWQYTQEGRVDGIDAPVDMNVAYFDYDGISKPMSKKTTEIAYPDPEAMLSFEEVNEEVTAKIEVNLRSEPDQDSEEKYLMKNGEIAIRTGISANGWSRLEFQGEKYYAVSQMLTTDMDYDPAKAESYDVGDTDGDGMITDFVPVNEMVTAKEYTNLRTLPSVEHPDCEVVYQLKKGETVLRTGIDETWGWSRLQYRSQICYAVSSMLTTEVGNNPVDLSEQEAFEVTMAFTETSDAVTARIKVNLRNMPSTEDPRSEVIYTLENGDVAVRTGIAVQGEWARVEYKGVTLYCINNYLKKTQ